LKEAEGNWPCKWMPISSNREAEAEAIQRIWKANPTVMNDNLQVKEQKLVYKLI
jgi:hypothetical protein